MLLLRGDGDSHETYGSGENAKGQTLFASVMLAVAFATKRANTKVIGGVIMFVVMVLLGILRTTMTFHGADLRQLARLHGCADNQMRHLLTRYPIRDGNRRIYAKGTVILFLPEYSDEASAYGSPYTSITGEDGLEPIASVADCHRQGEAVIAFVFHPCAEMVKFGRHAVSLRRNWQAKLLRIVQGVDMELAQGREVEIGKVTPRAQGVAIIGKCGILFTGVEAQIQLASIHVDLCAPPSITLVETHAFIATAAFLIGARVAAILVLGNKAQFATAAIQFVMELVIHFHAWWRIQNEAVQHDFAPSALAVHIVGFHPASVAIAIARPLPLHEPVVITGIHQRDKAARKREFFAHGLGDLFGYNGLRISIKNLVGNFCPKRLLEVPLETRANMTEFVAACL